MEEQKLSKEKLLELGKRVLATPFGSQYPLWSLHSLIAMCESEEEEYEEYEDEDEDEEDEEYEEDSLSYEYALDAAYVCVGADPTQKLIPEVVEFVEYVLTLGQYYGESDALNDLGALYYDGRMGQDFAKAEYYYKLAEKMGNGFSAENLGYIYYYGRCGEVDYEKAFQQFSKGASVFKRAISFYKLGDMYKNGYYVEKDPAAAYRCYENAKGLINSGDPANMFDNCAADIYFRLGEAKLRGIGTEVNVALAMEYLQTAERAFYVRLSRGEYMLKKVLSRTLDLEEEARLYLISKIPGFSWASGNAGNETL